MHPSDGDSPSGHEGGALAAPTSTSYLDGGDAYAHSRASSESASSSSQAGPIASSSTTKLAVPSGSHHHHSASAGSSSSAEAATRALKEASIGARKQNVACDNCRSRKVKCTRTNGTEKCDSCLQKQLVCTAHYVNALSHKERRKLDHSRSGPVSSTQPKVSPTASAKSIDTDKPKSKRARHSTEEGFDTTRAPDRYSQGGNLQYQQPPVPTSFVGAHRGSLPPQSQYAPPQQQHASSLHAGASFHPHGHQPVAPPHLPVPYASHSHHAHQPHTSAHHTAPPPPPTPPVPAFPPPVSSLLLYLFSPMEVTGPELGYSDRNAVDREGRHAPLFSGSPTRAHRSLSEEAYRVELAQDLVETYFQIVHIRIPLISPTRFRAQFATALAQGNSSHVLIAVVLAWGAKFSEHPIIAMDREETTALEAGTVPLGGVPRSKSRLVRLLAIRAAEVLEANRAFRVAKLENIQACLLMEGMMGHAFPKPGSLPGSDLPMSKSLWVSSAIRLLLDLQINRSRTVVAITDEQERGSSLFAWWLAALSDAHCGMIFRTMPLIFDEDYDVEPPAAWDGERDLAQIPHPLGNLSEYMVWYIANHSLAQAARKICRSLWTPAMEAHGIPLAQLTPLVERLATWRDEHLSKVGVPSVWPASWDFVAAVTACGSDSNYHCTWLVVNRALSDYDILEARRARDGSGPPCPEAEMVRERIAQEALHAALRISALAAVLTTNGYLRLDPNVLHFPVYEAGVLLAQLGRPEVLTCVAGLRQYGISAEQCYDEADMMESIYEEARRRLDTVDGPLAPGEGAVRSNGSSTARSADDLPSPAQGQYGAVSAGQGAAAYLGHEQHHRQSQQSHHQPHPHLPQHQQHHHHNGDDTPYARSGNEVAVEGGH